MHHIRQSTVIHSTPPIYLIINADGYGFTRGINTAVERCIEFGTVRSISVNINFKYADQLAPLVQKYPKLSVGCHVNPVVGYPVLAAKKIPSLLNADGQFFYQKFVQRVLSGHIRLDELGAEMEAQIEKTRQLVGPSLSHIDFHKGWHRLPGVYDVFLKVVEKSGIHRIRTHRYRAGLESRYPILRHVLHLSARPTRLLKYLLNLWLRRKALAMGLRMPDRWVTITNMTQSDNQLNLNNYLKLLGNLPPGFNEFVVHPGYVDAQLRRWSTYLHQRVKELNILLCEEFKAAIDDSGVRLIGYRDIPLKRANSGKDASYES